MVAFLFIYFLFERLNTYRILISVVSSRYSGASIIRMSLIRMLRVITRSGLISNLKFRKTKESKNNFYFNLLDRIRNSPTDTESIENEWSV